MKYQGIYKFTFHAVGQNFVAGVISVGTIAGITTVIFVYLYATVRVLFSIREFYRSEPYAFFTFLGLGVVLAAGSDF